MDFKIPQQGKYEVVEGTLLHWLEEFERSAYYEEVPEWLIIEVGEIYIFNGGIINGDAILHKSLLQRKLHPDSSGPKHVPLEIFYNHLRRIDTPEPEP